MADLEQSTGDPIGLKMATSSTNFPQELIDNIASYLKRTELDSSESKKLVSKLPSYACISRKWQASIESRTFETLTINNTELADFAKIMVGHRRRCLSRITYDIILPLNSDKSSIPVETAEDQKVNDEAFTDAIKGLFQVLKSWETDNEKGQSDAQPTTLYLRKVESPAAHHHGKGKEVSEADPDVDSRADCDPDSDLDSDDSDPEGGCPCCGKRQYKDSILRLLTPQNLPTLNYVSHFYAYVLPHKPSRTVEPRSMAAVAAKFTNLISMYFTVDDNEVTDLQQAQTLRHDFAESLSSLVPNSLRRIQLEMHHEAPSNQDDSPRSVLLTSCAIDHLSISLRKLSQLPFLTHLSLTGPILISPSFFWPSTTEPSSSTHLPFWPNLVRLGVYLNIATPSGSWYFTRNPADHDPDTSFLGRSFRTFPNDETITPLLVAMGCAAGRMPALTHMSVVAPRALPPMMFPFGPQSSMFYVDFFGEGSTKRALFEKAGDEHGPRAVFTVLGKWRPKTKVKAAWREAQRQEIGWKFVDLD